MIIAVNREYAIACSFEPQGDRGQWTFFFERWIGTGTYWICHPTVYSGGQERVKGEMMDLGKRLQLELAIETELGWWIKPPGWSKLTVPGPLKPARSEPQAMRMSREIIDGKLPLPESYLPAAIRKAILG